MSVKRQERQGATQPTEDGIYYTSNLSVRSNAVRGPQSELVELWGSERSISKLIDSQLEG